MSKTVRLLVTDIDGEIAVYDEEMLQLSDMSDDNEIKETFGNKAIWYRISLKDADYNAQQRAARAAGEDGTLLPQKRFVEAVEKWEKQYAGEESTSILPVSESAFCELRPPILANAVYGIIVKDWYPSASKSLDFFRQSRQKREQSEKDKSSTSEPNTVD
jgi:hypothetical protein